MGERIICFWSVPTGEQRLWLRRYRSSAKASCSSPDAYHTAMTFYADVPDDGKAPSLDLAPPKGDARWPSVCSCGEVFKPNDEWQLFQDPLYRRADAPDADPFPIREAPPGAMWNADWWPEGAGRGPDGLCLAVKTPGGVWMVDVPPRGQGAGWTRTGAPPKVTARPSILFPRGGYHAFLTDGILESC